VWRVELGSAARRDLKKLPHPVYIKIEEYFGSLSLDPYKGEPLHGVLKGFWKVSFNVQSVSYRIVYQILKTEKVVLIIMVGSRERFYERLSRRTK